jgi:hypothetical protein
VKEKKGEWLIVMSYNETSLLQLTKVWSLWTRVTAVDSRGRKIFATHIKQLKKMI